jgi:hypothetical protein
MQDFNFVCPYFSGISELLDILNNNQKTEIIVDKKNIHLYNRCFYSDHEGIKFLTVPVKKISGKKNFTSIEIDNSTPWKKIHFNAIKSAYGKTPYFSFYENTLRYVYKKNYNNLFEFNLSTFLYIYQSLDINVKERNFLKWKELKISEYTNHFGIKISEPQNLTSLEFLFRFGPAGFFELFI